LSASAKGQVLTITRRTMQEPAKPGEARQIAITAPDGSTTPLSLPEEGPGRYSADWTAPGVGLFRLKDGDVERVVALGPASPREFEAPIADATLLAPIVKPTNGGILRIENGLPTLRQVKEGRPAFGRGWIGITPRETSQTAEIRISPALPAWAFLLVAAALTILAWLIEGRGRRLAG
jgi:hypothetical protein